MKTTAIIEAAERIVKSQDDGSVYADSWARERDIALVVDAYLSQYHPDDHLPVSAEWLESVGFTDTKKSGCWSVWHDRFPHLGAYVSKEFWRLWINYGHAGVCLNDDPTRADVRQLARALGIELTTDTKGSPF